MYKPASRIQGYVYYTPEFTPGNTFSDSKNLITFNTVLYTLKRSTITAQSHYITQVQ